MKLVKTLMGGACALSLALVACDSDDENGVADAGEVRDSGDASGGDAGFDDSRGDGGGGTGVPTGTGEQPDVNEPTSGGDANLADGAGDLGPFDGMNGDAPGDTNEDGLNVADLIEPDGVGIDGFLDDSLDRDMIGGIDADIFGHDVDFDGIGNIDVEDPDGGTSNLDVGSWDGQLGLDGSGVDAPVYLDTNVEGFDIFNPPTEPPTDIPDF